MILNPSTTFHEYASGTRRTVAREVTARSVKSTVGALAGWSLPDNEPQETIWQTCHRAGRTACKLSLMKTTAHPLEFSFAAESFNLAGETITAAEPTTAGQLPDFTTPAAELLPEPGTPPAGAPWFQDTAGEYIATVTKDETAAPFPFRYTLHEILTGRPIARGYEATALAARAAAADMAAALAI